MTTTNDRVLDALERLGDEVAEIFLVEVSEFLEAQRENITVYSDIRFDLMRRAFMTAVDGEPTAPAWLALQGLQADLVEFRELTADLIELKALAPVE